MSLFDSCSCSRFAGSDHCCMSGHHCGVTIDYASTSGHDPIDRALFRCRDWYVRISRSRFPTSGCLRPFSTHGDLYKELHPSVQVICGSIGNSHTIAAIHHACPNASVLMSGFSCQPFSAGGQQQGIGDSRANALHDSLFVAKTLRCRAIILECVPSAATNSYVRYQLALSLRN